MLIGADDTDGVIGDGEDASTLRSGTYGSATLGPAPEAAREAARALLERTRALIPRFEGASLIERCELKLGVRPMPADGKSIAGPFPDSPGLHLAITHSGITLSPAIGTLLAEAIVTGSVPSALEPFGFERFQSLR